MGNLETKPKHLKTDAERIRDLQHKLYRKSKQEKDFRFYVLYDKVSLMYFLREAYRKCKAKGGCAGVDGISFNDIEQLGVEKLLAEITQELEDKTYRPQAVLRVEIPKANGKLRPLGIPTIKDRVIQMSVKMLIEPIFEADFEDCSHGFRPKRSAKGAVKTIKHNLHAGKCEIFDADLSAYFDTIPHTELMKLLAMRISDNDILHLIKMWLKAPVCENNQHTGGRKNKTGTPQGGVISPLLANIYLNLLDKAVKRMSGKFHKYGVEIVRYADDFVLMAETIPASCIEYMKRMFDAMKLSLNEEKSHFVNAYAESFDFLGYTFRYDRDIYGRDNKYWNIIPSSKSEEKMRNNIREYLKRNGHKSPQELTNDLNTKIRGWINYFTTPRVSYPAKAKRNMRYYLNKKLTRCYKRKSQRKCKLYKQGAFRVLTEKYGLIDPTKYAGARTTVKG